MGRVVWNMDVFLWAWLDLCGHGWLGLGHANTSVGQGWTCMEYCCFHGWTWAGHGKTWDMNGLGRVEHMDGLVQEMAGVVWIWRDMFNFLVGRMQVSRGMCCFGGT